MSRKRTIILGLGALASLLAIGALSCQTTGTFSEETMMKSSTDCDNYASGCPCTKEDKHQKCQLSAKCSCGGEEQITGCSETACGGE